MSNAPLTTLTSRTVVLPDENIDTDQIIPARFLSVTSRDGLGPHAFNDWRWNEDGSPTDHLLNTPEAQTSQILVGGHNFGCGSSREHAPWALTDYGFRVVISSEIADIFRSNAVKNGLLPIVIDKGAHRWLLDHPGAEVSVDLTRREVHLPGNGGTYKFDVDDFSAHCLIEGVDELGYLDGQAGAIADFEKAQAK